MMMTMEGSFPDEAALAAMQDDYEAVMMMMQFLWMMMKMRMKNNDEESGFPDFDGEDDDEDDEDIDPAEKAAWEAFMKESQSRSVNKEKEAAATTSISHINQR